MANQGVSPHRILEKLSEKIDSIGTGSVDYFQVKESLVRKLKKPTLGFMSDEEVSEVLNSSDGKQRLGKVVEILKGKGAEEYESFESMLRKSSLTRLADELVKIKTGWLRCFFWGCIMYNNDIYTCYMYARQHVLIINAC